ncbi:MAG: hypothetical protein FRX48_06015 [Lasallia pustulata]|uniref:MICOS complex subunit MIC12 n=1 Tax=Lasallia pustulata TaxID=136370 RepID=A0A1W5DBQ3_9LECA|nr:MAG: hypothetical protein FRX48_06015 [Lasallia pustulata]SLM40603.1 hypothetical protein LPUS_11432 [Lasallia pustulata]
MGFPAGFLSGLTLTSSLLYLSLFAHQRSRQQQARLLRHQSFLLNSLVDPELVPSEAERPRYVADRPNWAEMWKDRWNSEIEGAVRWVQDAKWGQVRRGVEERVKGVVEGERRM